MSDGAAPLADGGSSAPTTTTEIAASVIESAEQDAADSGGGDEGGSTRIDTTNAQETSTTQPVKAVELSPAGKFLLEQGHQNRKWSDGRDTRLPYGTVEKMLERYAEQHRTGWQTEKQTIESRAKELQSHIDSLRAGVAGDPKAFLSELAGIDPRYKAFLEQKAAEREAAVSPDNDPMPGPDFDLGNGQKTYSLVGLQKRDEWVERQMLRKLEGKIEERFKPIAEREKAEKDRAEHDRMMGEIHERSTSQMQEAQSWPHFGPLAADGTLNDVQQAVLDELKKDTDTSQAAGKRPQLSLEGAYIRVISKRIGEDENAKRARLLKEISTAPKSTAVTRTGPEVTAKPKQQTTVDIARSVIAKLEA